MDEDHEIPRQSHRPRSNHGISSRRPSLSNLRSSQAHSTRRGLNLRKPWPVCPFRGLVDLSFRFRGRLRKLMAVPGGIDVVFHPHNLYDYGVESDLDCGGNGSGSGGRAADSCLEESGTEHETWVRVERLEKGMCGRSRPVFFRGVATIVAKLFNIVEPDVAVFGKKDHQQWRVIRRMVRDLDFSINIVGSEIVRDADGLAMSSRNVGLSPEERQKALSINRSLSKAKSAAERGELSCKRLKNLVVDEIREANGQLDYAEIVEQESLEVVEEIKSPVVILVAAWFGKVRFIDNMEINI